jgi:hypothetical protein
VICKGFCHELATQIFGKLITNLEGDKLITNMEGASCEPKIQGEKLPQKGGGVAMLVAYPHAKPMVRGWNHPAAYIIHLRLIP